MKKIEFKNIKPANNAILELRKISKNKWARIWCEMNSWKLPSEFEHVKPDWWNFENSEGHEKKYQFLEPIMEEITDTIGHKACNREWNRHTMTDEEHNVFWEKSGGHVSDIIKYKERNMKFKRAYQKVLKMIDEQKVKVFRAD